jgi:pilus assembly protein Flp/PilA
VGSITWPRTEDGASAVEYGLLLAGLVAMLVVVVGALGGVSFGMFDGACASVDSGSHAARSC